MEEPRVQMDSGTTYRTSLRSVEVLIRSEVDRPGQEDSWDESHRDIGLRKAEVSYHCL